MGFFFTEEKKKKANKKPKRQDLSRVPKGLLREQGCKVCALNRDGAGAIVPPSGDKLPVVYVLGEMPGPREVQTGIHFKGETGSVLRRSLRDAFPEFFQSKRDLTKTESIRFNYCVQCPTPKHIQPRESELECCRKRIEKDIEESKPFAIIGLGPIALKWLIGYSNIDEWRGRKIPVKVGSHTCWYFPIQTPALLKKRQGQKYKNEYERAFDLDLIAASDFIMNEESPKAYVYTGGYEDGITVFEGLGSAQVKKIEKELEAMKFESSVSIDIETDRLKPFGAKDARIATIAIGTFDHTIAFPIDHPRAWVGQDSNRKKVRELVNGFMLTARGVKAPHNLKFEAIWFNYYYGQKCLRSGNWGDTMAQAYTLDNRTKKEKNKGMLGIGILTLIYFGFNLKKLADIDVKKLIDEPLDKVLLYNGRDTKWQHKTYLVQDELLEEKQRWTYEHLVRTGISFALTETDGVDVDDEQVVEFYNDFEDKIEGLESSIAALPSVQKYNRRYDDFKASKPANIEILFKDVIGLKSVKETDKGGYSTDDEVLKIFSGKGHREADLISEYRAVTKLKSTYIDPLMRDNKKRVLYPDLMIHGEYNHLFTSTGRTCIAKGTMIDIVRDVSKAPLGVPIEDVRVGDLAYTYDSNKKLTLKKVLWSGKTGHKEVIRLHWLGQGRKHRGYLDVTPDHRIRLVDGTYKEAQYLTTKDRTLALGRRINEGGYSDLYITGESGRVRDHRFIYEALSGEDITGLHIHHKDENKLNNLPANLEGQSAQEHTSYHSTKNMTPERKLQISEHTKGLWKAGRFDHKRGVAYNTLGLSKYQVLKLFAQARGHITKVPHDHTAILGYFDKYGIDYRAISLRYSWKDSSYISKGRLISLLGRYSKTQLIKVTGLNYYRLKELIASYGIEPEDNHIVTKIEWINKEVDVYDLEIEGTHNFIANEICVHNSSENPNMQNFPKRKNKEIRSVVAPPPRYYVVAVDYGQLEARIIAMASQDKKFCEAVRTGYDVHLEWAERILKLHPACAGVRSLSDLDKKGLKEFRQRSKNEWVFPLFFGSHFTSVANSLGLPMDKAERLVKDFWGEFKGVATWQKKMVKFYNEHGYVETLTGARRQGPLSYNELINAPIQGSASYVVNDGQARLSLYAYEEKQPQFQPRMNIHDDLTFFIPEASLEDDIDIIAEKMCCTDFDFINVPLAVEVEVGPNWADTEEVMTLDTTDFN